MKSHVSYDNIVLTKVIAKFWVHVIATTKSDWARNTAVKLSADEVGLKQAKQTSFAKLSTAP